MSDSRSASGRGSAARAAAEVEAFLAEGDLDAERLDESSWFALLSGERKRTIPVHLTVGERHLAVRSHFLRTPDENEAGLFTYLLGRHLRSYVLRFALTPDGDIVLLGVLPHLAVTAEELDRLLGQLLATADDAYEQALRLGFGSYIEREQRWRAARGVPRNPIT